MSSSSNRICYCNYCKKQWPFLTSVPCDVCIGARYCSKECRTKHAPTHREICEGNLEIIAQIGAAEHAAIKAMAQCIYSGISDVGMAVFQRLTSVVSPKQIMWIKYVADKSEVLSATPESMRNRFASFFGALTGSKTEGQFSCEIVDLDDFCKDPDNARVVGPCGSHWHTHRIRMLITVWFKDGNVVNVQKFCVSP